MYLSVVQPDFSQVNAARALVNEQDMHRNIQAMFASDRQSANVLYRAIPSRDISRSVICIQSDTVPQDTAEIKVVSCTNADNRISGIRDGMVLHFDVLLRPVRRHKGKSTLIRGKSEREEWVKRLGERYGFMVETVNELSRVQKNIHHTGTKPGRMDGWRYTGTLVVNHADIFKRAYETGIGRDRAYGFGMLMIKISLT